MATFDGPNLLITLGAPTGGVLTLAFEDLYEEWLVWLNTGYGNRGYPPCFTEDFGGNPLTTGIKAGAYFVFNNDLGWRIKPYEADHTIYAVGNFPPALDSLPIAIPTVGGYTVFLDGLQPVTQNVDSIINQQNANITKLQYLIESQREHHTATGNTFYVDPVNGDDTNDGSLPSTAVKTIQCAHDNLAIDNNHDIIQLIPGDPTGQTVVDETISITKNYLFIRGPGKDFKIEPTSTAADTILISGDGVELSGMIVNTAATGSRKAIYCTGNFPLLRNIWIENAEDIGIHLDGVATAIIENIDVRNCSSHGICFNDISYCHMSKKNIIHYNGFGTGTGSGIHVMGTSHGVHIHEGTDTHNNKGYGLHTENTTQETHIHPNTRVFSNIAGNILDEGTEGLFQLFEDIHDEAMGKWIVDEIGNTLTLYRADGTTVLKTFNLGEAAGAVPAYISRTPA